MRQLDKRSLLKHAQNEYLGAVLAAKVARRLHRMPADDRPDPHEKVTSLALRMINEGKVEYEVPEREEPEEEEE